jgi:hypothetical protein
VSPPEGVDVPIEAWVCWQYMRALEKASGDAEATSVALIAKAARQDGHWAAAAWQLERHHPKRWGRRDALEVSAGGARDDEGLLTGEAAALAHEALRAASRGALPVAQPDVIDGSAHDVDGQAEPVHVDRGDDRGVDHRGERRAS